MPVTTNTNHVSEGLARLIATLRKPTSVSALLQAFLERVQDLENDIADVRDGLNVDTAADYQLDILGAIVGEPREGRTDAAYRIRIKARIRINRSNGHPDEVLEIMTSILNTPVTMKEFANAAFELYALITDTAILGEVSAVLRQIKPAGVRGTLTYHDAGTKFVYDGAAGSGYDGAATYSDTID